jgi:hypothetical protein
MIKKLIIPIILLWFSSALFAQEYLTGLHSNPLISANKYHSFSLRANDTAQLYLPFLDDFSYKGEIYPTDTLWADRDVFINSTYCLNPPTIGVATFDAINDTGAIYPSATPTPFLADKLTSLLIHLDKLFDGTPITVADSVYLSFYYQPQGVADAPNPNDSLVLEFYVPGLPNWIKVWGSGGETLDSFRSVYNRYFKQVVIPIVNPIYLKDSFQFRFRNYASIAPLTIPSWQSNVDEWNVDYVYLNTRRSKADTFPHDIAFVDPAPTILQNYQEIPSRHFTNANLTTNMVMKEIDLNNISTNMFYKYIVTQENGPFTYTHDAGVFDILSFLPNGYQTYPLFANPAIDFTLPSFGTNDSVIFDITHIIGSNGFIDKNRKNDTVVHRQVFYNSYAYDDGTAENGYGLSGASAKLAYEFNLNQPDTLGGIEMYFNETLSNPYFKYFYVMVWSSLDPETIIYKSKRLRPEFADSINTFHTYQILDTSILVSGKVYVGWLQTTDDNLNVGFDRNHNSQSKTFFNVDGTWAPSALSGSLMIRPMMGTSWQIKNQSIIPIPKPDQFSCSLYPNPTRQNDIGIRLLPFYNTKENKDNISLEIYDNLGRQVATMPLPSRLNEFNDPAIDISFLNKGVYFIHILNYFTNETTINKLVILR